MKSLKDRVVAVTGAASGIGRGLAEVLAERGARLALSDVQEEALEESAELARRAGARRVSTHRIDVGQRDELYRYADEVIAEHGDVDVLINNAGVVVRGTVESVSDEDFQWLFDVNVWGVVHGVRAFLPELRKRPESCIVNVSSINAMVPFPENGPYNMSKYAVAALSETLEMELAGSGVRVVSVHPGGVKTNIVRTARKMDPASIATFDRIARTTPRSAAETIVRGIERDRFRVFVGMDAQAMQLMKRLLPNTTVRLSGLMGRLMRR